MLATRRIPMRYARHVQKPDPPDVMKVRRFVALGMPSRKFADKDGRIITTVIVPESYRRAGEERFSIQAALPEDQ